MYNAHIVAFWESIAQAMAERRVREPFVIAVRNMQNETHLALLYDACHPGRKG